MPLQDNTFLKKGKRVIMGLFLFLGIFALSFFIDAENFKADIFSVSGNPSAVEESEKEVLLLIHDNYIADSAETGEVIVRSNIVKENILGFSFDVFFPKSLYSAIDISTDGTLLAGKNFFVQKNIGTPGKISIVAATGGAGVSLLPGDELLKISGKISNSALSGEQIPLSFGDVHIIGNDLSEEKGIGQKGKITIGSFEGFLGVTALSAKSSEFEVEFSEEISNISLSDLSFSPNAVTENSRLEKNGKIVRVTNLSFDPGEEYSVSFSPSVTGNGDKKLRAGQNMFSFIVQNNFSDYFLIDRVYIESSTNIKVVFSEKLDEDSVTFSSFSLAGISFSAYEILEDKKTVSLTLADQTPIETLTSPQLLVVENSGAQSVRSESGASLRVNMIDVFQFTQDGPVLKKIVKKSDGIVDFEFTAPLFTDTVQKDDFALYDTGNISVNMLSDENVEFSFEDGYKTVRFKNIPLPLGKMYMGIVKNASISDTQNRAFAFPQVKIVSLVQQDSFDENFKIESVTSKSLSSIEVVFSSIPSDESVRALHFALKKSNTSFTITDVRKDNTNLKAVYVFTEPLQEGETYNLLAFSDKWQNTVGKYLGGKNSEIFVAKKAPEPLVSQVVPNRIVLSENREITLYGENFFSEISVYAKNIPLDIVSRDADGTKIVARLPQDLDITSYDIVLQTQKGENFSFPNAFIIEEKPEFLEILAESSYTTPKKIPNDGATLAKLFVLVDDPKGLADIDSVVADMRSVEGDAAVFLEKGEIVDGKQFFVLPSFTVPPTVGTSKTPYEIPVVLQNKKGESFSSSVNVLVSNDITSSIPPEIKNAFAEPKLVVTGDTKNPLRFFVEVFDEDGGDDIQTVALEMGKVGGETVLLTPKNSGNQHSKTRFYEYTAGFVVPGRIADGNYDLPVKVIDTNGDETRGYIDVNVRKYGTDRPKIDRDNLYISPQENIIRDGKTVSKIHVKVSDPAGADDIESVTANLESLGFGPVAFEKGVKEGKSQWYSSPELVLPKSVSFGTHSIEITVSDIAGNTDSETRSVRVVEKMSTGTPPHIFEEKGYSTPASIIPDGKTPFGAYVFVEDVDNDISHVVLHLKNYAKFVGENLPDGISAVDKYGVEQCISTRTMLCLNPILKEGTGQWFYINDLIVPQSVEASSESYHLPVIAVDKEGHTSHSYFELFVGDLASYQKREKPYFKIVQPISASEIQLFLSSNIDPNKIRKEYFTLSLSTNKDQKIDIRQVSASPDGRLVTLQTLPLISGNQYSLQINAEKMGLRSEKISDTSLSFEAFQNEKRTKSLRSTGVKATSPKTFALSFNQPINFVSSLNPQNFEAFVIGSKEKLSILSTNMIDNRTIEIRTTEQSLGQEYEIFFKNIIAVTGEKIAFKTSKKTSAFALSVAESLASLYHRADFNSDQTVDFKDFTLFASVYGESADTGDFNSDQKVDFADFTLFSSQYNQSAPSNDEPTTFLTEASGSAPTTNVYQVASPSVSQPGFDSYGDAVQQNAGGSFHAAPSEPITPTKEESDDMQEKTPSEDAPKGDNSTGSSDPLTSLLYSN